MDDYIKNRIKNVIKNAENKWLEKCSDFMKKASSINNYINEQIRKKYITKAIKTGTLLVPVEIKNRRYIVDFIHSKIYIGDMIKRYLFFERDNRDAKEIKYWNYLPYIELYKNYSRQYKDIKLIFEFLDNYFNKKLNSSELNITETVKIINNILENNLKYFPSWAYFDSKFYYITYDEGINYNKKYFNKIYISIDELRKYIELYKTILTSNFDDILIDKKDFVILRKILSFLSNFEITQYLFCNLVHENFDYLNFDRMNRNSQYQYIENVENNIGYNKEVRKKVYFLNNQDSFYYDSKVRNLFYSPMFFKFVLPQKFAINGNRILAQVSLYEKGLGFRERGLYEDIKNDTDICITFFLIENNQKENNQKITVLMYMLLSDFIENYLMNSDCLKSINFSFVKENNFYVSSCSNENNIIEPLMKLINKNKKLLLEKILDKIEKHLLNENIQFDVSISDEFKSLICVKQMDEYLTNLINSGY